MQSFIIMPMRRQKVAIAFGRVLREARRQKGLSQEELAGDAEFDRTYPSLLERGLRTPTLTVLIQLADVLEVSAASLVNRTLEELDRSS
jgi:transcriptional regulator with XRE-family HTH domain